jgi:hypothetical protein
MSQRSSRIYSRPRRRSQRPGAVPVAVISREERTRAVSSRFPSLADRRVPDAVGTPLAAAHAGRARFALPHTRRACRRGRPRGSDGNETASITFEPPRAVVYRGASSRPASCSPGLRTSGGPRRFLWVTGGPVLARPRVSHPDVDHAGLLADSRLPLEVACERLRNAVALCIVVGDVLHEPLFSRTWNMLSRSGCVDR